jgi:hypothetical protein
LTRAKPKKEAAGGGMGGMDDIRSMAKRRLETTMSGETTASTTGARTKDGTS